MAALNWCIFRKNLVFFSSAGPKVFACSSYSSLNFQPISDCFIPNFKLKYGDSESMKAHPVNTVVFDLRQIKRRTFFGTPGSLSERDLMVIFLCMYGTSNQTSGVFWSYKLYMI